MEGTIATTDSYAMQSFPVTIYFFSDPGIISMLKFQNFLNLGQTMGKFTTPSD